MKRVLALDLGTSTGWALRGERGQIYSGTIDFRGGRHEGGGMRFLRFSQWLEKLILPSGASRPVVDELYYEEVRRHLGTDAAHIYGGLLSQAQVLCESSCIPYKGVPVGTIKRHATGSGNASKDRVILAMRSLGHNPANSDEADALALLNWATSQ